MYLLTHDDLAETGGLHLIQKYHDYSVFDALRATFPDHRWESWKFSKARNEALANRTSQRELLEKIGTKLRVDKTQLEQWYSVTAEKVREHEGGRSLMTKHLDSLSRALQFVRPFDPGIPFVN